jgi:hypothetical protein
MIRALAGGSVLSAIRAAGTGWTAFAGVGCRLLFRVSRIVFADCVSGWLSWVASGFTASWTSLRVGSLAGNTMRKGLGLSCGAAGWEEAMETRSVIITGGGDRRLIPAAAGRDRKTSSS